jgi:hypothetical protein
MVGSADGRVVECSSAVADRARCRAIMSPKTPAPAADDADRPTAQRISTVIQDIMTGITDRPQRAGAGVAEWG